MEVRVSTAIGMLIIFAIILPTAWVCYRQWTGLVNATENYEFKVSVPQDNEISPEEKNQIDNWIIENNLNQFGDPKDTAYPGGSPLFSETTGNTISKYEYIIQKHPTRPWKK